MPAHMRFARSRTGKCLLTTAVALCALQLCWASGRPRLDVGYWGPSFAGCDTSDMPMQGVGYVVGGMYDIEVRLYPDGASLGEYQGVTDWSWPKGLIIKVGLSSESSDLCEISKSVRDMLDLEYYVTDNQRQTDSLWRASGLASGAGFHDRSYHFGFRVPPELAGSHLCATVEWNHPTLGRLQSQGEAHIRIVAPGCEAALHHVWTSQVQHAGQEGAYDRAISLADSFLTLGWHDFWGLSAATTAARRAGRMNDLARLKELLSKEPPPRFED